MRQSAKGVIMPSQLASGLSPCMLLVFVLSVVGYGPLFCEIAKNSSTVEELFCFSTYSIYTVGHVDRPFIYGIGQLYYTNSYIITVSSRPQDFKIQLNLLYLYILVFLRHLM